jgi:hypothetical protein
MYGFENHISKVWANHFDRLTMPGIVFSITPLLQYASTPDG